MRTRTKVALGVTALALMAGIAAKTEQATIGASLFERAVGEHGEEEGREGRVALADAARDRAPRCAPCVV